MSVEVITLWLLSGTPSSCWGFYSTEWFKDVVLCTPSGETSTLPRGCTVASGRLPSCLCIRSLPWAAVWKASVPRSPTGSWWVSFSQLPSGAGSVSPEFSSLDTPHASDLCWRGGNWNSENKRTFHEWVRVLIDKILFWWPICEMDLLWSLIVLTWFFSGTTPSRQTQAFTWEKWKKKSRVIEMFPFYRFSGKFFY